MNAAPDRTEAAGQPPPAAGPAWLFHGVTAVAVGTIVLAVALLWLLPPFPGRLAGAAIFGAAWVERMAAMYGRPGPHRSRAVCRDWTAVAVGYAYAITMGVAVTEFLLRRRGFPFPALAFGGGALYTVGVALRYWAFAVLRRQWRVDVTDVGGERRLVREGPYRLIRHPLYLGACLEAAGMPLLLGAPAAAVLGLAGFVPFEVARAFYEERFLREIFGDDYRRYSSEVPAFLPFRRRPSRRGRTPGA
jgi:protein-S-isoprenylcysteine O-methyltransferase Ste14